MGRSGSEAGRERLGLPGHMGPLGQHQLRLQAWGLKPATRMSVCPLPPGVIALVDKYLQTRSHGDGGRGFSEGEDHAQGEAVFTSVSP